MSEAYFICREQAKGMLNAGFQVLQSLSTVLPYAAVVVCLIYMQMQRRIWRTRTDTLTAENKALRKQLAALKTVSEDVSVLEQEKLAWLKEKSSLMQEVSHSSDFRIIWAPLHFTWIQYLHEKHASQLCLQHDVFESQHMLLSSHHFSCPILLPSETTEPVFHESRISCAVSTIETIEWLTDSAGLCWYRLCSPRERKIFVESCLFASCISWGNIRLD